MITADNTIITACQSLVFEDETTFRDRFIRHPKAFLAAQSVIVPDPDLVLEAASVSSTINLLDDWIKLLSEMRPALEEASRVKQKAVEYREDFDRLASKIKSGWQDHIANMEEVYASSSKKFRKELEKLTMGSDQAQIMAALRETAAKKVREVHRSWADFLEQVMSTSYVVFDHARLPIRPRIVPAVYFGRYEEASATIRRISGSPHDDFSLDDIRALESADDDGYTFCVCFSALFASLGKWQTAELVANQALIRCKTVSPDIDDLSGREAYFVRAISQSPTRNSC